MIYKCIADGILESERGEIRLSSTPWTKELRALLSAFVGQQPQFKDTVRTMARLKRDRTAGRNQYGLFGKGGAERVLCALVSHGRQTLTALFERSRADRGELVIRRLEKIGLLTVQRDTRNTYVSLHRAHPIYKPLANLLKAKHGLKLARTTNTSNAAAVKFSADSLFFTSLRMDVLAMLYLAGDEGIYGADLKRLRPHHDRGAMLQKIWDFCGLGFVVEDAMDFGVVRYRLNLQCIGYRQFCALMAAVVEMYPHYERTYAHREVLWPSHRATRERNRQVRKVRAKAKAPIGRS